MTLAECVGVLGLLVSIASLVIAAYTLGLGNQRRP